jgi:hypothetical protein
MDTDTDIETVSIRKWAQIRKTTRERTRKRTRKGIFFAEGSIWSMTVVPVAPYELRVPAIS